VKDTTHQTTPEYSKLIGIPYKDLDCWGVVREFYSVMFNIELYKYYETTPKGKNASDKVHAALPDFKQVDSPRLGDIILIRLNGLPSHVGVFINDTHFLHTKELTGCILDRIGKWDRMIEGFFRWPSLD
jgi:cell wall-associated NlpC family hydrolase